jgi:hypothetical protein
MVAKLARVLDELLGELTGASRYDKLAANQFALMRPRLDYSSFRLRQPGHSLGLLEYVLVS